MRKKGEEKGGTSLFKVQFDILEGHAQIFQQGDYGKGVVLITGVVPVVVFVHKRRLEQADLIVVKEHVFFDFTDFGKLAGGKVLFFFHVASRPVNDFRTKNGDVVLTIRLPYSLY